MDILYPSKQIGEIVYLSIFLMKCLFCDLHVAFTHAVIFTYSTCTGTPMAPIEN